MHFQPKFMSFSNLSLFTFSKTSVLVLWNTDTYHYQAFSWSWNSEMHCMSTGTTSRIAGVMLGSFSWLKKYLLLWTESTVHLLGSHSSNLRLLSDVQIKTPVDRLMHATWSVACFFTGKKSGLSSAKLERWWWSRAWTQRRESFTWLPPKRARFSREFKSSGPPGHRTLVCNQFT